ncbi:MAG: hypothetical protein JWM25_388 [Thermoleophilia bacterium]|nr:hypothetical protein [Thermoleophilia bacterium]MCZ4495805.1 hypothetical protein [Thermoleophilia bacterium]
MNVVVLVGNLATDPELRHTANGRAVCTFRLAVSRVGGEEADFVTVVTWERQAEVCAEYLATGRRIAVEGRLHHSTWEVEDGRRSKVEVVAHRVEMLGKPRSSAPDLGSAAEAPDSAEVAELALA